MQSEDAPIIAAHMITALPASDCGKVKGAMDKCVRVGEVDKLAEWKEAVTQCIGFGGLGRPDEVRLGRRARAHQVGPRMIAQPKALIHSIHA